MSPRNSHHCSTMYRSQLYSGYVHPPLNHCSLIMADCRFFFHERTRKIAIWACAFIISPYLGHFLSAIVLNYKSWRTSFWVDFLITGLALTFVTFLCDETIYDHDSIGQPPKPTGFLSYKVQMLSGWYGAQCKGRPTMWQTTTDLFFLLTRPYFLCLCCSLPIFYPKMRADVVFYMATFTWGVGINQTLALFLYPPPETRGYEFSNLAAALFYIAPMTAVICGGIFSYFFSCAHIRHGSQ